MSKYEAEVHENFGNDTIDIKIKRTKKEGALKYKRGLLLSATEEWLESKMADIAEGEHYCHVGIGHSHPTRLDINFSSSRAKERFIEWFEDQGVESYWEEMLTAEEEYPNSDVYCTFDFKHAYATRDSSISASARKNPLKNK